MTFRLVQVVAVLDSGDGIGGIVSGLHAAAERLGIDAHICSESIARESLRQFEDTALERLTRLRDDAASIPTVFVYHYGIHNEVLDRFFKRNPTLRRVMYFHNLTPPHFFRGWEPAGYVHLQQAALELPKTLADPWVLTGASWFNLSVLPPSPAHAMLPPVRPVAENACERSVPDEVLRAKVSGERLRLLFVGRFAPNKRQDVLLFALHALRRRALPCELTLAGKGAGTYLRYLRALTLCLGLSRHVRIAVNPDAATLAAFYERSSHLVVASEHEGFCVPVIEALSHGVLPVARPFGALGETLKGATTLAADGSYSAFFDVLERALRRAITDPECFLSDLREVRATMERNLARHLSPDEFLRCLADSTTDPVRTIARPELGASTTTASPRTECTVYHGLDFVRTRMIEPFLDSRTRRLTTVMRRFVRSVVGG